QRRMDVAGQRPPIFDTRGARVAYRSSRGVPRLLNTICDRSLLGAYATGRARVTAAIVRRAAREVPGRPPRRQWIVATATSAVLVTVGGTITLLDLPRLPHIEIPLLRGGAATSTP